MKIKIVYILHTFKTQLFQINKTNQKKVYDENYIIVLIKLIRYLK